MDDAARKTGYKEKLTQYDQYLRKQLGGSYIKKGINRHSLQFQYHNIKVDLLLSPHFDSKEQYYLFLERVNKLNIDKLPPM